MLFAQLGDLQVSVQLGALNSLAVLLLVGESLIDRFAKGIFSMECRIVPIQSPPVPVISEYTHRRTRWLRYRLTPMPRPIQKTDRTKSSGRPYFLL